MNIGDRHFDFIVDASGCKIGCSRGVVGGIGNFRGGAQRGNAVCFVKGITEVSKRRMLELGSLFTHLKPGIIVKNRIIAGMRNIGLIDIFQGLDCVGMAVYQLTIRGRTGSRPPDFRGGGYAVRINGTRLQLFRPSQMNTKGVLKSRRSADLHTFTAMRVSQVLPICDHLLSPIKLTNTQKDTGKPRKFLLTNQRYGANIYL